jgi:DNA-directed RNA polymerase subunit L
MRSAVAEAEALGYEKGSPEYEDLKQKRVAEGIRNRKKAANSPAAPVQPGPTLEGVDDVTVISSADTKRNDHYRQKTVMLSTCQFPQSNQKGLQTALDNLVKKIEKYINTFQSYIDKVSSTIEDIQLVMKNAAREIAKYIKPLLDKVMEFVMKKLNEALTIVVAALPSSLRHKFADMKKILTELILCLYNKLTQGLGDLIGAVLDKALNLAGLENKAKAAAANSNGDDDAYRRLAPKVPPCYAEDITAQVFAVSAPAINEANESLIQNLDNFLDDTQKQLAGVSGALDGMVNKIPDISGSLTAALGFENIKINLFGCELEPNCPVDDYYTIQGGGAGQPDAKQPSDKAVEDAAAAQDPAEVAAPKEDVGYIQPTSGQQDVKPSGSDPMGAELDAELERSRAGDRSGLDDAIEIS